MLVKYVVYPFYYVKYTQSLILFVNEILAALYYLIITEILKMFLALFFGGYLTFGKFTLMDYIEMVIHKIIIIIVYTYRDTTT